MCHTTSTGADVNALNPTKETPMYVDHPVEKER